MVSRYMVYDIIMTPTVLSLFTCSKDAMISGGVLVSFMLFTVLVLQLMVYGTMYQGSRACYPIVYYFGEAEGCKQTVARIVRAEVQAERLGQTIRDQITYQEYFDTGVQGTLTLWQTIRETFSHLFGAYTGFMHEVAAKVGQFRRNVHHELVVPAVVKATTVYRP